MVDIKVPGRDQIAAMVGSDPAMVRYVEGLFRQVVVAQPETDGQFDQRIVDNQLAIAQNTADITFNQAGIASNVTSIASNTSSIADIQTAIAGLSSGQLVFVASKADLPAPVSGVITLAAGVAYYVVGDVDLEGDRLVAGGSVSIVGASAETSFLRSTGLASGTALLTSEFTTILKSITLTAATAIDLDGLATPGAAIDWTAVNFIDCPEIGRIKDYGNAIFSLAGFINSSGLVFDGTIGTVGFVDSIFVGTATGTIVTIPSTAVITRRFRLRYCAVVAFASAVAFDASLLATYPDEGYIFDHVNFSGGATYLAGLQPDDVRSLFQQNVGVKNSTTVAFYTMIGNATETPIATAGVPVKASGTTVADPRSEGFDMTTTNRALYSRKIKRTFKVTAIATVAGGTFVEIMVYLAKNDVVATETGQAVTTGNAGRVAGVSCQGVFDLSPDDYIEYWIENTTLATNVTVENLSVIVAEL